MQIERIKLTAFGTRDQLIWALKEAAAQLEMAKDKPAPHGSKGMGGGMSHDWLVTVYPPPDYTGGAEK